MQTADTEKISRNDEESINFRPSPNFKHMKKYFRAKFEENQCASNGAADSPSYDEREKLSKTTQEVPKNPPLPKNPPPPDSVPIKKEIEDDEYQNGNSENTEFNHNEGLTPEMIKTDQSETTEKIMCRNFVRGTCKKEGSCIFAHELILSQLQGVYTFCRNYQNSVCTLPKCKFVHATVFEKEYFYRTGYLPPHTLRHLKEGNVLQPPPPPPPPEETPNEVPQVFPSVQPPPPPPTVPSVQCISPISEISNGVISLDTLSFRDVTSTTSPKREWSDRDEFGSSSSDDESSDSLAKKCKLCDSYQFRLLYHKNKVRKLKASIKDINKKLDHLEDKKGKLYSVLYNLVKIGKPPNGVKNLTAEKEKAFMEQFDIISKSRKRIPFGEEESQSSLDKYSALVAKLLMALHTELPKMKDTSGCP